MKQSQNETRRKILQVAGKLLSQKGYFGVSMQDIASEVHITKAALYYHFKGKDELVEVLMISAVEELKKELRQAIEKSKLPSDVIFNLTKAFLDFKIKHPEISLLVSLVSTDEKIPVLQIIIDLRTELIKFVRDLIEGADFIRVSAYKSAFLVTNAFLGLLMSPFLHTDENNHQKTAEDISKILVSESNEEIALSSSK